jgi:hypothetical protein
MITNYLENLTKKIKNQCITKIVRGNFLFLICLTFFFSCSKEIEINTRDYEKRLVVNSVFNTHKPFFFHFSYTEVPINSYRIISDSLHVILYEDTHIVFDKMVLTDSLLTNIYPTAGCLYKLKVQTIGFDTVIAYETLPYSVSINEATIKPAVALDSYGDKIAEVGVTFTDLADRPNYYELLLVNSFAGGKITGYVPIDPERDIIDSVLLNEGDKNYFPSTLFFSDELFDGQEYTLRFRHRITNPIQFGVVLRSISKNYYMYRKYWTRHYFNQPTHESGFEGLIYKGESQAMFTNIVNGYGIFTGYIESQKSDLKVIK